MKPVIPNLSPVELRELADKVAREDGYQVRSFPTVLLDRSAMLVTFLAPDGVAFPGSVPAARCAKFLREG